MNAFAKLQETLYASNQPQIKKGYKSAKEIASESGQNYRTVRENLQTAREKKLVSFEIYLVNGRRTAYYLLK